MFYNFLFENDLMEINFSFPPAINYTYSKGNIYSYIDHILHPVYMLPMVKKCVIIHDAFDNLKGSIPSLKKIELRPGTKE